MRVDRDIAEALEHAVAVVIGKHQLVRCRDAHEAGRAALVRTVRSPLGVGGREEKERAAFDEALVVLGEFDPRQFVEPVGDFPALEFVLQPPVAFMVHDGHGASSREERRAYAAARLPAIGAAR